MFHSQCVRTTTFVSCGLWYNHTLEAYMSKITSIDLIQWLAWKYSQMKKIPNHPQSSTKLAEFLFIFTWCYLFCFVGENEVEREIMRFNGNVSIHMLFIVDQFQSELIRLSKTWRQLNLKRLIKFCFRDLDPYKRFHGEIQWFSCEMAVNNFFW